MVACPYVAAMNPRATRFFQIFGLLVIAGCAGVRPPTDPPPATLQGSGGVNRPEHRATPHIVLVSLDGVRADYLDTRDVPNIRRVAQRGARAKAMSPVFPSVTFPNHYSLVTGLYPEHHGIPGNAFYDPARKETYALGNRKTVIDGTWYRGEPIWVTAEMQGMVAACFFWPGSEAAIRGVRPTLWKEFNARTPNDERVQTVLGWLGLPAEKRPHLVTLYFSDVDSASHAGTLNAPRVADALRRVDDAIGKLVAGIDALPIRQSVYLLITSDHGMAETTAKHQIRLDSLVDTGEIEQVFGGPVASIHVKADHGSTRSAALARRMRDQINGKLQHGRAYLRRDVPARHHFRNDPRIGDIVIIMDAAWSIVVSPRVVQAVTDVVRPDRWGAHGWDPAFPSMHAIFVAMGPHIRPGTTLPTVNNVDVYPLMTTLLGLRAPPTIDGNDTLTKALIPQGSAAHRRNN